MTPDARHPAVELVVVARDQAATLEAAVRRLHAHLGQHHGDHFPGSWSLTIADHASTDGTRIVAEQLARELDGVATVHVPTRLDRKALRARWATSPAGVAAFLTVTPTTDLAALLDPLVRHTAVRTAEVRPLARRRVSRRTALAAVGGIGLTALLAACSNGGSSSGASTTSVTTGGSASTASGASTTAAATTAGGAATTAAASPTTAATVVLAPEMTEGPYYLDLDLVRSDIVEDRAGAPLALGLVVVDVETATPIEGAAVDIWHCDADGLYSGFVEQSAGSNQGASDLTDSGTFLRGTQLTGADGMASFATIYPGWYQGRTVHIHVKVHVDGNEVHTGQLFFSDAFTDEVFAANEPYSARSDRTTRNDNDGIYGGGGDLSTVIVEPSGDGYAGVLTTGVSG